jgi:hypothetical protein
MIVDCIVQRWSISHWIAPEPWNSTGLLVTGASYLAGYV